MTKLRYILICACLFVFGTLPAAAAQGGSGETVDVKGIVFGHIGDSYEWHITSWNGRELSVAASGDFAKRDGALGCLHVVASGSRGRVRRLPDRGGGTLRGQDRSNGSTEKMSDRSICRSRKRLSR